MAWLGTWKKRRKITISNTNIDSALSDFPILVKISTSSGTGNDDITDIFPELGSDANRKKIAITTDNGETQCYVEIERFDYPNSAAWLWVKVPSVSDSVGTELYIYYDSSQSDNTTYIGDTTDAAARSVWDDNFKFVMHMAQDPNGDVAETIKDSTSNANHGTPDGTMTSSDLVDGKIGKGIDLDGGDDYINKGSLTFNSRENFTLEVISKITQIDVEQRLISMHNPSDTGGPQFFLRLTDTNYANVFGWGDSGDTVTSITDNVDLNDSSYHYIAGTIDGNIGKVELFVEGVSKGNTTTSQFTLDNIPILNIGMGFYGESTPQAFGGVVDEIRISNTARPSAWIKATYYSNWDELVTYGDTEVSYVSLSPFSSTSSIQADIKIEITNNLFSSTPSFYTGEIFNGLLIECPSPFSAQSSLQSAPQIEVNQSLFTLNSLLYVQPEIQIFTGGLLSATGSISATITDPFSVATLPRIYTFTLTGAANGVDDIVIPISSFQARQTVTINNYGNRYSVIWYLGEKYVTPYTVNSSYLSIVIPSLDFASHINDRHWGDLVVRMGYLSNGEIILSEIIEHVSFDSIIINAGSTNKSITLSGYRTSSNFSANLIYPTGISYRNIDNGEKRIRCIPALYIKPGDVVVDDGDIFQAKGITYSVSPELETFEVSE